MHISNSSVFLCCIVFRRYWWVPICTDGQLPMSPWLGVLLFWDNAFRIYVWGAIQWHIFYGSSCLICIIFRRYLSHNIAFGGYIMFGIYLRGVFWDFCINQRWFMPFSRKSSGVSHWLDIWSVGQGNFLFCVYLRAIFLWFRISCRCFMHFGRYVIGVFIWFSCHSLVFWDFCINHRWFMPFSRKSSGVLHWLAIGSVGQGNFLFCVFLRAIFLWFRISCGCFMHFGGYVIGVFLWFSWHSCVEFFIPWQT